MYPRRGGNSDRKRPSSNVMHNPDRSRAPLQPPPPVILQFPLARIRFLSGCATRPRDVPRNVHVHAVIIIIIREIRNSYPSSSPVVRTGRKKERKKRASVMYNRFYGSLSKMEGGLSSRRIWFGILTIFQEEIFFFVICCIRMAILKI